jgi:hypothetical protein
LDVILGSRHPDLGNTSTPEADMAMARSFPQSLIRRIWLPSDHLEGTAMSAVFDITDGNPFKSAVDGLS